MIRRRAAAQGQYINRLPSDERSLLTQKQEQATIPTPRKNMSHVTNIEPGSFTTTINSSSSLSSPNEEDGNVKLAQPESPRLYEQENNIGDESFNNEVHV